MLNIAMTDTAGVYGGSTSAVHPVLCGCPICRGIDVEDRGGKGSGFNKPSLTSEQAGQQIDRLGYSWNGRYVTGQAAVVTYSFRSAATDPGIGGLGVNISDFTAFTAAQMTAAEAALSAWSDVANITFIRVNDPGSQYSDDAEIRMINYGKGLDGAAAFAIQPGALAGTPFSQFDGDLYVNSSLDYNANPVLGGYGRLALVHELGHAIGLSHPGDYNAGNGSPTYNTDAEYREDSRQYSLMSYWSARNTGADHGGFYAAAPMLDDISAVQIVYGANMATRTGDTIYGFNSNTGRDWLSTTGATPIICAIWDAGGVDTLNFSGYTMAQIIDLGQGHFSSTGGLVGNIAIANGAIIENAVGGTGSDDITGNSVQNMLDGNGGIDRLSGLGGNDRLIAGAGGTAAIRAGHDQVRNTRETAISLDNAFTLAADEVVGNATTTPHASIYAEATGTAEFYRFTAGAGQTITLDIDRAGFDTVIYLFDATGKLIATNDDTTVGDTGSRAGKDDDGNPLSLDAFLTYTTVSAGTYYVQVRGIIGNTPAAGTYVGSAYQLNVSVTGHTLTAGLSGSTLDGGASDDVLVSGSAGDTLIGGTGVDTASYERAGSGVTVSLSIGGVQNTGGGGRDTLTGVERLIGSVFADVLTGDDGANLLAGSLGDDRLSGGGGSDRLTGGRGIDTMTGGAGADSFEFQTTLGGTDIDTITDFVAADDTVILAASVFGGLAVGALAGGAFYTGAGAHDGDDRIIYNAATGALLFDRDGSGSGAAVQFAKIGTDLILTSADFRVV